MTAKAAKPPAPHEVLMSPHPSHSDTLRALLTLIEDETAREEAWKSINPPPRAVAEEDDE